MPDGATGLLIAVSGGVDSLCLLTALAQLAADAATAPSVRALRAVHVDHGLQAAAVRFRAVCLARCRDLGVPLEILDVAVDSRRGVSIEAAARDARYRALAGNLRNGECLLTAHHAQDQAETVVLQLLRGGGLRGASAMPPCRRLGPGWHLRPLLAVAKQDLLDFAARAGVVSIADPMNHDLRFDRAYLRSRVWPTLEQRWPGAALALSRTARHMAEAQHLLDRSAALDIQPLLDGDTLSVRHLRTLSGARQRNVLRYWLAGRGVTAPGTALLTEALRQVVDARADHQPAVAWGDLVLRRYRDRLFLTAAAPAQIEGPYEWPADSTAQLELGAGLGRLRWALQRGGLDARRLPASVSVRRRGGGETLKPNRAARTQTVQHLCQSTGVLPWMRAALPLVYVGAALVAIGDLWLDARWCVTDAAWGRAVVWENAPILV